MIAFNLTIYADDIDRNIELFIQQFEEAFGHLAYHIGDKGRNLRKKHEFIRNRFYFQGDFKNLWNELTKTMRNLQMHIDQTPRHE